MYTATLKEILRKFIKIGPKGKIDGNLNCDTLQIYGEFGNGEVRELQVCKGENQRIVVIQYYRS